MQAEYAEWREPNPDRPWIASVRHAMRTMTLGDWLVCAAIVSYNVVTASFSKTEGGFFTGDVPKWTSKLVLGLLWAAGYVWLRQMWRKTENSAVIPVPDLPESWTHVLLNFKHTFLSEKVDFGGAAVEDGQLKFSGRYTAFQVNLRDIEIRHIDKHDHKVKLRIPGTRQRLCLQFNEERGEQKWQAFLEKLVSGDTPVAKTCVHPPKPKLRMRSILLLALAVIVADLVNLAGWRLAKALSLPTSIIFPILSLSLMGLAFWMLLRIDLLLWRRRGCQNKRGEV